MNRSSWMLQQLEHATRAHHVAADAGRIALLGSSIGADSYLEYLEHTYAFEAPIEARWRTVPGLETVVEVERRVRTPFLASDLQVLGATPQALPPAPFIGIEQALGWMYVVERGRRMNGMLHRHLMRRLPKVLVIAGNYLTASSPIGARWQQLGAALDMIAKDHVIADQIINAAHRAFRTLRNENAIDRQPRLHAVAS